MWNMYRFAWAGNELITQVELEITNDLGSQKRWKLHEYHIVAAEQRSQNILCVTVCTTFSERRISRLIQCGGQRPRHNACP